MIEDPPLVVQRILRFTERETITKQHLVGRMRGAQIADWLAICHDTDHAIALTDPMMSSPSGIHLIASLRWCFPEVGDERMLPIIGHACIASFGLLPPSLSGRSKVLAFRDAAIELSWRAMAYAAGQENALSQPPVPTADTVDEPLSTQ